MQSENDQCIFLKNSDAGKLIYVIWVDDIIVVADSMKTMEFGKNILKKRFKMKDVGTIKVDMDRVFCRNLLPFFFTPLV